MSNKPHDHFFRYVFSNVSIVRDFVKYLVSDLAEKIDLSSFEKDETSYISNELQDFYSDIVYNVKTNNEKEVKIAFLLEHKSTPPEFPHVQINEYRQGIWRNDIANFKKKREKNVKRKPRKLTHVIPILFYHGKEKWNKKPFSAYFDEIDEAFSPYVPKFDYYLVDLNKYSDEFVMALKAGFLINSLLVFKHKGDTAYVREHYQKIFVNLRSQQIDEQMRQFTLTLSVYIVNTTQLSAKEVIKLSEELPKTIKKDFMTAYDNILLEGEKIGIKKGIEQGIEKGIEQGIEIGSKREAEKKSIEVAIKMIKNGLTDELILNISDIFEETLLLLKQLLSEEFKVKKTRIKLAKHLILQFEYLSNQDIANFSKLDLSAIEILQLDLKED